MSFSIIPGFGGGLELKALAEAQPGWRFEAWAEIEKAIERPTEYWNAHKHPFVWGRHRASRRPGIAAVPNLTLI